MTVCSTHWAEAYIGTPWIAGESDCWNLAIRIWRERFGFMVDPVDVDPRDPRAVRRGFGQGGEVARWQEVEAPHEGDAVLMALGVHPCHVGVWVDPGLVLHSVEAAGVICMPRTRLSGMGYRIVGIYRRRT